MDTVQLLNTIRANASPTYQERIPEATRENIETIQTAMLDEDNVVVANEFLNMLMNKVVKQVIHSKIFSDPMKSLKKGKKPLGDTVEEIYANFLKAEVYDPSGKDLLQRNLPDVKAIYHRMNRKDKYKVTINREMLAKAFTSYEKLGDLVQQIINQLFNSSELDEFVLIKQLIQIALEQNALKVKYIENPANGEKAARDFVKAVKQVSNKMVFPSAQFNSYLDAQSTDNKEIITFSRKDEQVLIIDSDTDTNVQIDVLATVFNMTVAEFNDTKKIIIDEFPDPTVHAAVLDKEFFQIFDDLVYFSTFRNEEGIYDNYYLHIWQTLSYSILVNGVVFKEASDEDEDEKIETYTITKSLKDGVTLSNRATHVAEGSRYSATIRGLADTDVVTVTMGSETVEEVETPIDVTEDVYEDGKILIEKVNGDITITVAAGV